MTDKNWKPKLAYSLSSNNFNQPEGIAFDKSGNLWVTNSRIKNGLKVLKTNGQWGSYSMTPIFDIAENISYSGLVVDRNNVKWIATNRDGVVGFNETSNTFKKMTFGADVGNLPIADV